MTEEKKFFHQEISRILKGGLRSFPWRDTWDPYQILVSEIMLQQTQTFRVVPKYLSFLEAFPNVYHLAEASLPQVLKLWQGLGYNRRGKALHETAQEIVANWEGKVPNDEKELVKLPGIGPYTARAVLTFALNRPYLFIETNIRSVFLFHFFRGRDQIKDADLIPYLEELIDQENPRTWYYALMDYGVELKGKFRKELSQMSAHYKKQSKFHGSLRQVRGEILRIMLEQHALRPEVLKSQITSELKHFDEALEQLIEEGFILEQGGKLACNMNASHRQLT